MADRDVHDGSEGRRVRVRTITEKEADDVKNTKSAKIHKICRALVAQRSNHHPFVSACV